MKVNAQVEERKELVIKEKEREEEEREEEQWKAEREWKRVHTGEDLKKTEGRERERRHGGREGGGCLG